MIRLMTEDDIPVVLSFIHKTIREDPHYNVHQQNLLISYATPLAMQTAINNAHTVVYVDDDILDVDIHRVVGMASIASNFILYMFVDPLEQGKGIGQSLYDHLEKYARLHNKFVNKNKLLVFSTENAVNFYKKQGFEEKERINHVDNGQTIIRVRMEKYLA
jgi:ribosomal protein S18 acetylase RimI-like enzyme